MKRDLKWDFGVTVTQLKERRDLPEPMIQSIEANFAKIASVVEEYQAALDKAKKSGLHTPQGLVEHRKALAAAASEKVKEIEASLSGLDDNIKQTEQSLQPKPAPVTDPVQFLAEMEIRSDYKGKDQLECELAYHQALSTGNLLVASAIENSPKPLIRPEVIAEARQERARRENPEIAAKLDQLQSAKWNYTYAFNVAKAELSSGAEFESEITTLP